MEKKHQHQQSHATSTPDILSRQPKKPKSSHHDDDDSLTTTSANTDDGVTTTTTTTTSDPPSSPEAEGRPWNRKIGDSKSKIDNNLLYNIILRDVEPRGHRIILPFLSINDRLNLSACSKDLIKYRYQLDRLQIISPDLLPSTNDLMIGALCRLLEGQHESLRHLRLGDRFLIKVLQGLPANCHDSLKILDLHSIRLTDEDAETVGRALRRGNLRGLEELNLSGNVLIESSTIGAHLTTTGLCHITSALAYGACPNLRLLNLSKNPFGLLHSHADEAVAMALRSGYCRQLQELDLSWTFLSDQGIPSICNALAAGSCPQLRRLNLSNCYIPPGSGHEVGDALRAGGCPLLEVLIMSFPGTNEMAVVGSLADSLEGGNIPHLQHLGLEGANMSAMEARRLARGLSSGHCRQLRRLYLSRAFSDREGILHVLNTLVQTRCCPELSCLDLTKNSQLGPEHGVVLGQAIREGVLSQLEKLVLAQCKSLGDDGVVPIMEALEATTGCPKLHHLTIGDVGLGQAGAEALGQTLNSGALKKLTSLGILCDEDVLTPGPQAMANLLRSFGPTNCPHLSMLALVDAGMGKEGGQALIDMLRTNALPCLGALTVFDSSLDDAWVVKLAELIREGAGQKVVALELGCRAGGSLRELAQAFRQGGWPQLRRVVVRAKQGQTQDQEALEELHAALEERRSVLTSIKPHQSSER